MARNSTSHSKQQQKDKKANRTTSATAAPRNTTTTTTGSSSTAAHAKSQEWTSDQFLGLLEEADLSDDSHADNDGEDDL